MTKAEYAGPSEKLELYETLVASVEGVERKGAANPYTSRNGHMTSFIDSQGEVSIRLMSRAAPSSLRGMSRASRSSPARK